MRTERPTVGGGREEINGAVTGGGGGSARHRGTTAGGALGEHDDPLEVEDVPGDFRLLGGARGRRLRGRRVVHRPFTRVTDRSDGERQVRGRREWRRSLAQRRGGELDRFLAPQAHPEAQFDRVAARDRDAAVGVAHPMALRVAGAIEHGHGHARCGLARVLMHDPEQPDLVRAHGHRGHQYAMPRL